MKSPYLAQTLLLLGLLIWSFSELNILNGDAEIKQQIDVFDRDFGDQKVFPDNYKVIVDWGNQKFIYGSGRRIIRFKRNSSWTYDMSWIPFFKSYQQRVEWEVEGLQFDRAPIELTLKSKRFGFVSRSEMIKANREKSFQSIDKIFPVTNFLSNPLP